MLYKKGVILVGFPYNNHLGCDKHCSFCPFYISDYNIEVKPSDESVLKFLSLIKDDGYIQICGAGDPLFQFEKNYSYLQHLFNLIKDKGLKIQLVTKYGEVVEKNWDTKLKDIDSYVFSTEILSEELKQLIIKILPSKGVRIGKICNFTSELSSINFSFIKRFINFYSEAKNDNDHLTISLRCNFQYPEAAQTILQATRNGLTENHEETGCLVYIHGTDIRVPQLWNDELTECKDTINIINKHMKKDSI